MPGSRVTDQRFIALSKQCLSRLSYHWFKGIVVAKHDCNTLFDEARRLDEDPLELARLIAQEDFVYRSLWIVQMAYWICNINRYRENYYYLYSYYAYFYYQQEIKKMHSPSAQKEAEVIGGFILVLFGLTLVSRSKWFQRQINPYLPLSLQINYHSDLEEHELLGTSNQPSYLSIPNNSSSTTVVLTREADRVDIENSTSDNFLVIDEMLPLLKLLKINVQSSRYYTFASLKKAYTKCLRETHPDKTGKDSKQEFIAVMDAYNKILSLVSESNLFEMIQKEQYAWRVLREDIAQYAQRVGVYCKNVDSYIGSVNQFKDSVDEFIDSADEFKDSVDKYIQSASEFIEGVDQFGKLATGIRTKIAQEREEIRAINRALDVWDTQQAASSIVSDKSGTCILSKKVFFAPNTKKSEENTAHQRNFHLGC